MENLAQTAQFLEASSKLRSAAYWLNQLSKDAQTKPNTKGHEDLEWAGRFLTEVDWTSTPSKRIGCSGEFAIQATSIRPVFYSSLVRFGQELRDAGISDTKSLAKFFAALYSFLSKPEYNLKQPSISISNMKLGAAFLEEISQSLIVQLSGNGLPALRSKLWDSTSIMGRDINPSAISF